jgi:hypothetical protein
VVTNLFEDKAVDTGTAFVIKFAKTFLGMTAAGIEEAEMSRSLLSESMIPGEGSMDGRGKHQSSC